MKKILILCILLLLVLSCKESKTDKDITSNNITTEGIEKKIGIRDYNFFGFSFNDHMTLF